MDMSMIHRAIRDVRRLHREGFSYRLAAMQICKGQPLRDWAIEALAKRKDEKGEK